MYHANISELTVSKRRVRRVSFQIKTSGQQAREAMTLTSGTPRTTLPFQPHTHTDSHSICFVCASFLPGCGRARQYRLVCTKSVVLRVRTVLLGACPETGTGVRKGTKEGLLGERGHILFLPVWLHRLCSGCKTSSNCAHIIMYFSVHMLDFQKFT